MCSYYQDGLNTTKEKNQKVAVIMNELGEVNLDGLMIEEHIPMAEMMASCRMSVSFNKWPVMIHAAVSSLSMMRSKTNWRSPATVDAEASGELQSVHLEALDR